MLKLNEAEWKALRTLADDFRAQSEVLDAVARKTTFDLRLGLVAEQDVTQLRQRQAALSRRREEIVQQSVDRMKRDLAGRYEELRSIVESKGPVGEYFPRQGGLGRPIAKARAKSR